MDDVLEFRYEMTLEFSEDVMNHHFVAKIVPRSTMRQQVLHRKIQIEPYEQAGWTEDGYGNEVFYGSCLSPHRQFRMVLEGTVRTRRSGPEEEEALAQAVFYRQPTPFTSFGKTLEAFYQGELKQKEAVAKGQNMSSLSRAITMMHRLAGRMQYEKGSSTIFTTAEEAFLKGKGVCQDYAHILLALLRREHIPARYVVGLMTGEGESHAWVEVYQDGAWYGIDPTNGVLVNEDYVRISSGRDYWDCQISRGTFEGSATQKQSVQASVSKRKG